MKKLKVIPNPDSKKYAEMTVAVFENSGFCPCSFERTDDTKCPCKEFREQEEEGLCHCERLLKVGVDIG